MHHLLKAFLALGLAIVLALAVTLYLAIESEPAVRRSSEMTPANIKRARQILEQAAPFRASAAHPLALSEQDLDLAVNYLAHFYANGGARVTLKRDRAEIAASLRPPKMPLIFYFNLTGVLVEGTPLPRFEQATVGRVLIPGPVADWIAWLAMTRFIGREALHSAVRTIKQIDLQAGELAVLAEPPAPSREPLRSVALSAEDQERLRIYQERLALLSSGAKAKRISLTEPLVALFELAQARAKESDAAAESRAAILVLAFYASGRPLASALPPARDWPHAGGQTITLHERDDLARHFILAAATAAAAGGPLSNSLLSAKEIEDSRPGGGFSFADTAASRAGARFGTAAADSARSRKLQQKLAAGVGDADLMPIARDLPEDLTEAEFKRRLGSVGAPEYNRVIGDIDQRIAALRLYR